MPRFLKLFIGLISLTLSLLIAPYFYETLYFLVEKIGLGWVFSSILLRLLAIVFLIVGSKLIINSVTSKSIKTWIFILAGSAIGFGYTFAIAPIYDVDYFMHSDDLDFEHLNELSEETNQSFQRIEGYQVLAFLDVGCSHCMVAAQRLGVNFRSGQKIPIHLFFNGDEANTTHFRQTQHVEELTYHMLTSEREFIYFAGYEFPSVFLIDPNGEVVYHWVSEKLNFNALDYLLSLEQ